MNERQGKKKQKKNICRKRKDCLLGSHVFQKKKNQNAPRLFCQSIFINICVPFVHWGLSVLAWSPGGNSCNLVILPKWGGYCNYVASAGGLSGRRRMVIHHCKWHQQQPTLKKKRLGVGRGRGLGLGALSTREQCGGLRQASSKENGVERGFSG